MKRNSSISAAAIAIAIALGVGTAMAAESTTEIMDSQVHETLRLFYAQGGNHRELAQKAAAVLVFPEITKGGVGVGAEYGQGALQVHGKTVAYYKVTGASVGVTLGVGQRSEVILFMTDAAAKKFAASGNWTVGADAGVSFVRGVGGEYDTETLSKPVLAYVFGEQGLIADASLEGAKVSKVYR